MQPPTPTSRWIDTLITALAPAIWGSTYFVTTEILPAERPMIAALLRCLPAGLILVLISGISPWPRGQAWIRLAVLGALNIGLFQAALFIAAYRLPGGLAAVIGAVQPLLVMGLIWMADGKRPAAAAMIAAVIGIGGMALLLLSPDSRWDWLGVGAALGGAACMSVGTWLVRGWRARMGLSVMAFTGWQLLLGGLMLAPAAWLLDPPLDHLTLVQGAGYAYLCLAGAVLAYGLWFRGLVRLSPVAVSSLGLLSPLTAVIIGWLALGQSLGPWSMAGMIMVLGSVLAVQRVER